MCFQSAAGLEIYRIAFLSKLNVVKPSTDSVLMSDILSISQCMPLPVWHKHSLVWLAPLPSAMTCATLALIWTLLAFQARTSK